MNQFHLESELSSPAVQKSFLKALKAILPEHCKPIINTDAGFRVSWFKAIAKLNWDVIGRVRGHLYDAHTPETWLSLRALAAQAYL